MLWYILQFALMYYQENIDATSIILTLILKVVMLKVTKIMYFNDLHFR